MNYIKDSNGCWTVVAGGQVYTFDKHHPKHDDLVTAIKAKDEVTFNMFISVGKTIQEWSKDGFVLRNGSLFYGTEEVAKEITDLVLEMVAEGFDEQPILNFMKKLFQNPSSRAVDELYTWLKHKSLAIHEDGDFLAYKSLRVHTGETFTDSYGREVKAGDYVDKYTGTIRNNVGDINEMPRRKVNDDFRIGCSDGYHVGSLNYVMTVYHSEKQVICKVNPADVVSVPLECDCQKIRCSKYEVVSEFKTLQLVEKVERVEPSIPEDEDVEEEWLDDEDEDEDESDAFEDDDEDVDIWYV